jgi:hypothetical protein
MQDDVYFIKTKSLVYSVFHSNARYINFEIGYSVQAKWFEYLKDRWNDYSSFYIGGFIEGIYSVNEKGYKTVYIQVDARSIDYDQRYRTSTTSTTSSNSPSVSSSPKSQNAFALRRSKVSRSFPSEPAEKVNNESSEDANLILIDDDISTPARSPKKRQISDLCDELDQTSINKSGCSKK